MTHVYLFGSGDCGQMGMGEDIDLQRKPTLHPFLEDKNIISVAAGGLHTLALSSSGRIFSWGCNDEKALGHHHTVPEFQVAEVHGLEAQHVVQVAAGDSISAALTADGRVFAWGTFRDSRGVMGFASDGRTEIQERPTAIEALKGLAVKQIAAGANHLMAITADGQLYSWGCGEQGQLGRRVLERHKLLGLRPANITPRLGRSRVVVAKVVCGSYHTLVLGADGNVWAMGLNNYGQLGLGDHEERITADLIDPENWRGERVVDAAAGEHHSLVLLSSGHVLAFGRADSCQLGVEMGTERASPLPVHIGALEGVRMIASGGNHCLAADANDRVVSWGFGEMHQLGHGPAQDEKQPRPIETKLAGPVVQLAAGGQHSVILTQ